MKREKIKDTEEYKDVIVPFKFFPTPERAFQRVLSLRIGRVQAETFKELIQAINALREEVKKELDTTIQKGKS